MPVIDLDAYLKDSVRIESFAIEEEFIRLPADLAFWNEQYAQAYKAWQEQKLELERLNATLSLAIRDELQAQNKGRVTLAEIEQVLHTIDQYKNTKQREIELEAEKVRLYGVVDAVRSKKEMLISLGAHLRFEMGNDPAIRQQARIEREVDQAKKGL